MSQAAPTPTQPAAPRGLLTRFLDGVERVGNKLPDPAVLFLGLMLLVWVLSALLANVQFEAIDPRSGEPIKIKNLLAGASLTGFASEMVKTFVRLPAAGRGPGGHARPGRRRTHRLHQRGLRAMLGVTPKQLLTPVLIGVGVLSHVAVDAGYCW